MSNDDLIDFKFDVIIRRYPIRKEPDDETKEEENCKLFLSDSESISSYSSSSDDDRIGGNPKDRRADYECSKSAADFYTNNSIPTPFFNMPPNEHPVWAMICPSCSFIARPPLTSCAEGHLTCGDCSNDPYNPTCNFRIPSKHQSVDRRCGKQLKDYKSHLYVKIFKSCILYCKYERFGCKKFIKGEHLAKHEENCKFSPQWLCAFRNCNLLSIQSYKDHLIFDHGVEEIAGGPEFTFDIPFEKNVYEKWEIGHFKQQILGDWWVAKLLVYKTSSFIIIIKLTDGYFYFFPKVLKITKEEDMFPIMAKILPAPIDSPNNPNNRYPQTWTGSLTGIDVEGSNMDVLSVSKSNLSKFFIHTGENNEEMVSAQVTFFV